MADEDLFNEEDYFAPDPIEVEDPDADDDGSDDEDETPDQATAFQQAYAKYCAPIPDGGEILEATDQQVLKQVQREIRGQKRLAKNRDESRKHWEYVAAGAQFSALEKSEDQSIWKQIFPPDVSGQPEPIPNKIADVKNKMVAQVLVDTPLPKPIPDGDDERARLAEDLTRKFLRFNAAPDNCNDAQLFHDALDLTMTSRSSFVYVWVDPTGGGWRPWQIKAHPQAEDPDSPMSGPKLGPDDHPLVVGGTTITERAVNPVLRYVTPKGDDGKRQFTDSPASADRQWVPKVLRKLLVANQVRTLPRTADVRAATGVILLMYDTLGEAKKHFPVLRDMPDPLLRKLVAWRPSGEVDWKTLVPQSLRTKTGPMADDDPSTNPLNDDTFIFWYHRFCKVDPDYKDGADVAVSGATIEMGDSTGAGFILKRDTLREDVELDDGTTVPVLFPVPVAQFRGLNDIRGGDPFGLEVISDFGGANGIYAHLYLSIVDVIDKNLHRNMFLPSTSTISRADVNRRDGTPLIIETAEDKPTYEDPPQLPGYSVDLLDRIDRQINSLARTNETTNGLDSRYSESGTAKEVAINQAKVGLRDIWLNVISGCCDYWTIVARIAQAKLTVPQLVMLTGNDSAYRARWWVGADLVGISRIALEPGSGSMMSPSEKAQWLAQLQGQKWLEQEQAGELVRSAMSDDLGLPPNVHEERINRAIGDWLEGPPPGWEDLFAQHQQQQIQQQAAAQQAAVVASAPQVTQGQPQAPQASTPGAVPGATMAPQPAAPASPPALGTPGAPTGAPSPQPAQPPAPLPPLFNPFDPRPNDEHPFVATIHEGKLSRLMASADYTRFTPGWRSLVDAAWKTALVNSGVQTIPMQQAAQQAQMAQGQQDQATQAALKLLSDVQQKSVNVVTHTLAAEVGAAQVGMPPTDKTAPGPGSQPEPQDDLSGGVMDLGKAIAQREAQHATAATKQAELAHKSQESRLNRAHQSAENAKDRALEVQKHAMTHRARAHETALKASLTPRNPTVPHAPVPTNPMANAAGQTALP